MTPTLSALELRDAYRGERAAVILGGPSLIHHDFDFASLQRKHVRVFVESKALTPRLVSSGLVPDFLVMSFPEKCKDNGLQHFAYRALLAGVNVRPLLRRQHAAVVDDIRANADRYLETWNPRKGPHKRFRWRPDVFLKDSPFDLLRGLPGVKIIANGPHLSREFPGVQLSNPVYVYEQGDANRFDLETYYRPLESGTRLVLRSNPFLNSAAIAMYPLLAYMGFREVYLLGMDMSMLGVLEYAAPYTFRSMLHFRWFVFRAHRVFNADYRMNKPFYLRPKTEFEDLTRVLVHPSVRFVRVHKDFRYAAEIDGLRTISLDDFNQMGESTGS